MVVHAGEQFLLLERREPVGYWQSVTGSLLAGEDWQVAAQRELFEETGLSADGLCDSGVVNRYAIHPAWRYRYAPEVLENEEHVFWLPLPAPVAVTLNPREHAQVCWLSLREALARVSSDSNRAAIAKIASAGSPSA